MNKEQLRKELEDAIHAYLNWCHTSSVLLSEDTVTQWLISESGKAITTRLAALDDGDDYVEGLKELLRFDHCPEILIENPGLIKGQPATPESIAWANECIARYEANKEKEDKSQEEMWDKFRADIYYGGFINNLADSKEVTELINYWKTKYFISSQPKLLDDGQEGKETILDALQELDGSIKPVGQDKKILDTYVSRPALLPSAVTGGVKWVKASERLPENDGVYYCKFDNGDWVTRLLCKFDNGVCHHPDYKVNETEWLDENQ